MSKVKSDSDKTHLYLDLDFDLDDYIAETRYWKTTRSEAPAIVEIGIKDVINSLPPASILEPRNDEQFLNCEESFSTIQKYAFAHEFPIVTGPVDPGDKMRYNCPYDSERHGTHNNRS